MKRAVDGPTRKETDSVARIGRCPTAGNAVKQRISGVAGKVWNPDFGNEKRLER